MAGAVYRSAENGPNAGCRGLRLRGARKERLRSVGIGGAGPISAYTCTAYMASFSCGGCDQSCLSIRKLSAGALYSHKDGLGSP